MHPNQGASRYNQSSYTLYPTAGILHLYTVAVTRYLTVEQYLNGIDQHSTDHKGSIQQVTHHHCRGRTNHTSNMPSITLV